MLACLQDAWNNGQAEDIKWQGVFCCEGNFFGLSERKNFVWTKTMLNTVSLPDTARYLTFEL